MGDIQKNRCGWRLGGGCRSGTLSANGRVAGLLIPVLFLEYEYQACLKFGRIEQAKMLRRWLEQWIRSQPFRLTQTVRCGILKA